MRRIICLMLVTLTLSGAGAVGPTPVTLNEALTEAFNRHPNLRRLRTEVNVAGARVGEVRALTGVQSGLSMSFRRQGPTVEFPTTPAGTVQVVPDNFFSGSITAQKLLFDGGRSSGERRASELGVELAREELREAERQLTREVKHAYYGLLKSERLMAVAEETLKIAAEQLRVTQVKFAAGTIARFDVTRSEVEVSNAKQELITAEKNVALARSTLNHQLSRPLEEAVTVVGPSTATEIAVTTSELVALARQHRPELKLAEQRQRQARERTLVAQAARLPQVSLQTSYTRQTGTAFQENYNWFAGVGVTFDWFTSGRRKFAVRAAQLTSESADATTARVRQMIELEVTQVQLSLREARQRIETTAATVRSSLENLDIARLRYNNGVGINLEVMDAQLALSRAHTHNTNAVFDYWVALADLEAALGRSLP